jgi:GTP-binding protein EngB required for normal cell division
LITLFFFFFFFFVGVVIMGPQAFGQRTRPSDDHCPDLTFIFFSPGYPNVGKSSLINSLKRSRACGVGATPGFTRSLQEIVLDKHVKLIDSPGPY